MSEARRWWLNAACAAVALAGASGDAAAARGLTTLYNFTGGADGGYSEAPLAYHAGVLFGTTNIGGAANAGTVFAVDAATGSETVLYSFSGAADGGNPVTGLVFDAGILYGTTYAGGATGQGTVFKLDIASGRETVLHSFTSGAKGGDGHSGLILRNGILYGTTYQDGQARQGTVFKVNAATGAEAVIYSFAGHGDGANPVAGVIARGGSLWGTTVYGGSAGDGTVFRVDLATGGETVVHSFSGLGDGANPNADLIAHGGSLYGTTTYGGSANNGTAYKLDPATGQVVTLHSFLGYGTASLGLGDGANPLGALIYLRGQLYGTTSGGIACQFASDCGTTFQLSPSTGAETVRHRFSGGGDGGRPYAHLTYQNGTLFGTTSIGGTLKWGTVFKFVP